MESSRSGSGKVLYLVPEHLRKELSAPVGIVLTNRADILNEIKHSAFLITVGDVVTLDLLESGIIPDISIVDYMTKRESIKELKNKFSRHPQAEIKVVNPPGVITLDLWNAITDAIANPRQLRIVVEGEEDLAALACIMLAPDNTTVIYGIPNRGASVHHVNDALKKMVKDTLDKMRI
jgi:uncharacterized protein (UPF0218 family)